MNRTDRRNGNRVQKKIGSESGASITFALLLFLVCAALSAIVLVAATAAAGRMSGLAENEQDYYAVTSAAGLINQLLDNKSVSYVSGIDYPFSKPMNEITEADLGITKKVDDVDEDYGEIDTDTGTGGSGSSAANEETLVKTITGLYRGSSTGSPSMELTFRNGNNTIEPLSVTITENINKEAGTATLMVSNKTTAKKKKVFTMMLVFDVEEKACNPPVIKTGDDQITGTEYTWHLYKMVSAYEDK